ncbi:MAG: DUF4301 family protein [Bacteroidales bacterium]|nr:DUF4301 family protein [Bacteroidales bacterium]
MLDLKDLEQLKQRGVAPEQVEKQLAQFKSGFPFADIQRAATIGDGILKANEADNQRFVALYDSALKAGKKVVKFIPASGAATRMFKSMFEYKNADAEKQVEMSGQKPYDKFFAEFDKFAFAKDIKAMNPKSDAEKIELMLDDKGLGYGQKPKGVIKFHAYENGARTAAEEHLEEGLSYANSNGIINLHFTVSPQHLDLFKAAVIPTKERIEKEKGVKINISYSFQKLSTDTLAATMDNEPFRDSEGKLVFRPGGHGALIENLNDLDADMVFIKNIDNVAQDHLLATTSLYKKVIAGYAIDKRSKVDDILSKLDKKDYTAIAEAEAFMKENLQVTYPSDYSQMDDAKKSSFIVNTLDRPLRVCGMVKNEGEPGGGPFWVKGSDGQVTLQVVESAQIDVNDPKKAEIMKGSTHFNPVDLFCCITDRNGRKYDLTKFVDVNAGFISYKSLGGKELKAMELPGLWNGAMANWLTFFVEVPVETFNPVKTVVDLLRPQHQPK